MRRLGPKCPRGLTLVEMVLAIALIGLLTGLMVPLTQLPLAALQETRQRSLQQAQWQHIASALRSDVARAAPGSLRLSHTPSGLSIDLALRQDAPTSGADLHQKHSTQPVQWVRWTCQRNGATPSGSAGLWRHSGAAPGSEVQGRLSQLPVGAGERLATNVRGCGGSLWTPGGQASEVLSRNALTNPVSNGNADASSLGTSRAGILTLHLALPLPGQAAATGAAAGPASGTLSAFGPAVADWQGVLTLRVPL